MTGLADSDLTCDAFLDGRVHLWQPRTGYRAGIDAVLLAAAVPAKSSQSVLDLGCGAGAATLCLGARVPGLYLTGVERQRAYANLAVRNGLSNDVELNVLEADISDLPADLRQRQFDHVIANPPYFDPTTRTRAQDPGREAALAETTPLERWIDVASRRLASKGYFHMIQHSSRVPELLAACQTRLGSIELLPLSGRHSRAAHLVILRARKGGRGEFLLHAPLILHAGDRHDVDGDSYAPEISRVLRDGAPLPWPAGRR